jgi:hypothetical protein
MLIERSGECDDALDVVRARVGSFLSARGCRLNGDAFSRGSLFGTLTGLNPRRWKVRATLQSESPGRFRLRFDVNTTGQMVTDGERQFWEQEFAATLAVVVGAQPPNFDSTGAAVASANRGAVKAMLLYAVIGGAAFGLLQYVAHRNGATLLPGFTGIGAGLGVAFGFQKWRQDEARRGPK